MHSRSTYHVLIVGSATEEIQNMLEILRQQNIKISFTQSGKDAFDRATRETPHLVVLESALPDMNGFAVCAQLKHEPATQHIPIIFFSTNSRPDARMKGFQAGAVDYITKPCRPEEFLLRVQNQLELKSSHDALMAQNRQLAEQNSLLQERYALKKQDFSGTLEDSEERFRSTFEQAAVGLAHAAMDGRFLRINQRFCDIVNYTQQEIQTYTFQEITFPDDLNSDLFLVQQLLDGTRQTYSMEKRYVRKDGTLVWVNLTVSLARDASGAPKYFIKVVEDISQRKQAEDALRTSEQQYRLLADRVSDGIGIIQQGKLVFVNEALSAMLGVAADKLIGTSPVELFRTPENVPLESGFDHAVPESSTPHNWPVLQYFIDREHQKVWLEGRQSIFTWQGQPAVLIDMRDITERKLREMAMTEERNVLRQENIHLRVTMQERYRFGDIIGKSPAMQQVYELIIKAAALEKEVLICGESGTGKELVARTIHHLSERQERAFVPVNCGAVSESLFEREFFGHRKGSFTGAESNSSGYFGAAHQGTLFLDEIGELPLAMQVKLLRVIDSGEYTAIGETTPKTTDVRIIAATHRNLPEMVQQQTMREDFFYRIHVIVLVVPPLRERKGDIPLLIDHFLKLYSKDAALPTLPGQVWEALYNHDWPGNIRQLQNTLYRYLSFGSLDFITPRSLPAVEQPDAQNGLISPNITLHDAVEHTEKRVILNSLERHRWHKTLTAAELGIPRSTLRRKMKKLGLQ